MHAAVVAVGLDPVDGVVVEQRLRAAGADDGDLLDRWSRSPALARETLDDTGQPLGLDGLDEVVEGLDGEGVDRVALVRRDEDDSWALATVEHEPRHFDSRHPRQFDVEEDDVVAHTLRERECLTRGSGLADDLDLGMRGEQVAQLASRRRLVVHDQRADAHTGTSSRTTVPKPPDFRRTPSP